jgi:hypothetical protein
MGAKVVSHLVADLRHEFLEVAYLRLAFSMLAQAFNVYSFLESRV